MSTVVEVWMNHTLQNRLDYKHQHFILVFLVKLKILPIWFLPTQKMQAAMATRKMIPPTMVATKAPIGNASSLGQGGNLRRSEILSNNNNIMKVRISCLSYTYGSSTNEKQHAGKKAWILDRHKRFPSVWCIYAPSGQGGNLLSDHTDHSNTCVETLVC